jgi:hypothetical protein
VDQLVHPVRTTCQPGLAKGTEEKQHEPVNFCYKVLYQKVQYPSVEYPLNMAMYLVGSFGGEGRGAAVAAVVLT